MERKRNVALQNKGGHHKMNENSNLNLWLPYQFHPNINPECFSNLVNETQTTINNTLHDQHVERKNSLKRRKSYRANIVCVAKDDSIEEQIIDENYHEILEHEDAQWLSEIQNMLEGLDKIETHWSLPSPIKRRKGVRRRKIRPSIASLQEELNKSYPVDKSFWGRLRKSLFSNSSKIQEELTIEDLIVASQSKLQVRRPLCAQVLITNTLRMIEPTKFKQLQVKDRKKRKESAGPRFGPRAVTRRKSFDIMALQHTEQLDTPSGFSFCVRNKTEKHQLSDDRYEIEDEFRHFTFVKDATTAQLHTLGLHLQDIHQKYRRYFDDKIQYTVIDDDEIIEYEFTEIPTIPNYIINDMDSAIEIDSEDDLPLHLLMKQRRLSIISAP
eukprot:NODE_54_length_30443_cov_1.442954.p9 type:complete len:384 gc:universal NODE_54_length_30443_cov_1.442954:14318-15469(+)